jgi:hypothetical protein
MRQAIRIALTAISLSLAAEGVAAAGWIVLPSARDEPPETHFLVQIHRSSWTGGIYEDAVGTRFTANVSFMSTVIFGPGNAVDYLYSIVNSGTGTVTELFPALFPGAIGPGQTRTAEFFASGDAVLTGWGASWSNIVAAFQNQSGPLFFTPLSSVAVVPEPGTSVLLLFGLAAMVGFRRRSA